MRLSSFMLYGLLDLPLWGYIIAALLLTHDVPDFQRAEPLASQSVVEQH